MAQRGQFVERFAQRVTVWAGSSNAFCLACGAIVLWLMLGPVCDYSNTWQLAINTATTIITFLMVFLIQRAQNKDIRSLNLKLNELVAVKKGASNRLINVEDMSEAEVETLHRYYCKLAELTKKEAILTNSHSIEEAECRNAID